MAPDAFAGMTLAPYEVRPFSRGSVRLKSADAAAHPALRMNYLHDERDRHALLWALRFLRGMAQQPALAAIVSAELRPGPEVQTDDDWLHWLAPYPTNGYHPVGSCRMGRADDPLAMCTPDLRVRGVDGLRVIDASVMPNLICGNTNATAVAIGDKGADLVLARAGNGQAVWVALDPGAQVQCRRLDTLDPSTPYAELHFDTAPGQALEACPDALALLERVRDRAAILIAFEELGGADAALEMAAAYARERKACGRAIGSYQGIKHKLADVYTAIKMARAHCWYGAWPLATDAAAGSAPAAELAVAAAAARVSATQASSLAAQVNIQTHGGMGTTWETDCHLFYRRARQTAVMLGSSLAGAPGAAAGTTPRRLSP